MVRIVAHRGDRAYAPENTVAAFEQALAKGADSLEMDLQLSSDFEVIVFHDEQLHRLTRSRGTPADYPAAELGRIQVQADRFPATAQACIPTLAEVLDLVADRCPLYLELKSAGPQNGLLVERVLDLLPPSSPHTLASFDREIVDLCLAAGRPTALIAKAAASARRMCLQQPQLQAISLWFGSIDESLCKQIAQQEIELWAWTVNDRRDWWRLQRLGVQAICTDNPGGAVDWRESCP